MSNSSYFLLATAALIAGYIIYGSIVARVFGVRPARPTPAITKADGVDFVEMPTWKIWLIQLLNIAGVGPVFGPLLGAVWGPVALLWIVLGTIFGGAVHDYTAGMLSVRYDGANLPTIIGNNLGNFTKQSMRLFAIALLVLVGVVFVAAPATLLANLTPSFMNMTFWTCVIFAYYFVATIMPIDKIIGRFYPVFGAVLVFMAVGITVMMFVSGTEFYNSAQWTNQNPSGAPIFPLIFITIACGAISGFHATQSPLMARCMANEKLGKPIFYGSMVAEGFIGLVWATVGLSFYHGPDALQAALSLGGPGKVVTDSSLALMGTVGGILAILGVVVLPITSGDTAFRAARLTIAETFGYSQRPVIPRLIIAVPIFIFGIFLSQVDFNVIWQYFGWANQTLATITLWAAGAYLLRRGRCHWICTVPAIFMTAVCVAFICYHPTMGLAMNIWVADTVAIVAALGCFQVFRRHGGRPVAGAPDEGIEN